jgi:hypothetical protein
VFIGSAYKCGTETDTDDQQEVSYSLGVVQGATQTQDWKGLSLKYTEVPKVFFTPQHR